MADKTTVNELKGKWLGDVFKDAGKLLDLREPILTGFNSLNSALDGGLLPMLYVIGAESSTGKSTFMLNMAEKIAEKNPVMYYSLEMPADQISRLIICHCLVKQAGMSKSTGRQNFARKSGLERLRKEFGEGENSPFDRAFEDYRKLGKNVLIIERDNKNRFINASDIYNDVRKFKEQKGRTPVVIVDYLQILNGERGKSKSDQRADVEYNVDFLSQTVNDLKAPVIAISSLSRASYNGKPHDITLASFKESGRIEYSADVVWALQSPGVCEGEPKRRALELRILKNRYGEKDTSAWLYFYPEFGLFTDGKKPNPNEIQAEVPQKNAENIVEALSEKAESIAENIPSVEAGVQVENNERAVEEPQENAADYKYMLNSKIVNYMRDTRDNSGFHGNIKISGDDRAKYCIAYYLRKTNADGSGAEALSLWDIAVLDAVYAVTGRGKNFAFTINALYNYLCGRPRVSHRSPKITEKIQATLERLQNRELFIDITEELLMRNDELKKDARRKEAVNEMLKNRRASADELKELFPYISKNVGEAEKSVIKGSLLPFIPNGTSYALINGNMPILFDYTTRLSLQEIKYNPQHRNILLSQKNFTVQKMLIRYYIIHTVEVARRKKKEGKPYICSLRVYPSTKTRQALLPLLVAADDNKMKTLGEDVKNLRENRYFGRWLNNAREDTELFLNEFAKHEFISGFETESKENGELIYKITLK